MHRQGIQGKAIYKTAKFSCAYSYLELLWAGPISRLLLDYDNIFQSFNHQSITTASVKFSSIQSLSTFALVSQFILLAFAREQYYTGNHAAHRLARCAPYNIPYQVYIHDAPSKVARRSPAPTRTHAPTHDSQGRPTISTWSEDTVPKREKVKAAVKGAVHKRVKVCKKVGGKINPTTGECSLM